MRLLGFIFGAVIALGAAGAPALAGTVRVQQHDGSVQVYDHVSITFTSDRTARITTHDGKGTLVITEGGCSYIGAIRRCFPYQMHLEQDGDHPIDFDRGTFYYNPTDQAQTLPYSSQQIPPHGVIGSMKTKHGTYVSVFGTLKIEGQP
jgi:hypothetical protein